MLLQPFLTYVHENHLFKDGDKVIVAVSGGVDSMTLADLMLRSGCEVVIAHCNFHLRGEDSNGDEQFVRDFAENHNVKCFVNQFDTRQYAEEHGVSIEMAARDLRYSWFEELRKSLNFDKIAVAHHSDDQIETFFINLFRSAGLHGLKGMRPANGALIRPLLWASRNDIMAYAHQHGMKWREDCTNAESFYLRNKIRNLLLPVVDEINPEGRKAILRSIANLSSEDELYRQLLESELNKSIKEGDSQRVDKNFFAGACGRQLLFEWLRQFGFNSDQTDSVFKAMNGLSGKHFLSDTHEVIVNRADFELVPLARDNNEDVIVTINEETASVQEHQLHFSRYIKNESFVMNTSAEYAYLDFDKLKFPLKIRHWRRGDRFRPLGMKGQKLLSDFFVDEGFTSLQKTNVSILLTADDDIVWIVGHRIDDRFKITGATKSVFECRTDDKN